MSHQYTHRISDRHWELLGAVSDQSNRSVAEVLRHTLDLALSPQGVNQMFPCLSGQIVLSSGAPVAMCGS